MKNDFLDITINPKGAEITSIKDVKTGFEFLWQADKTIWGRHAPILFPIVGKVKNNQLLINEKAYQMPQHGFARDNFFTLGYNNETEIWYELETNPKLFEAFPYNYTLKLGYELQGKTLLCHYHLVNNSTLPMYFSIGAHPGFNLPTKCLTDYEIEFEKPENNLRYLLTDGLFDGRTKTVFTKPDKIALSKRIFDDDAIVLHNTLSKCLTLKQINSTFAIKLYYEGFDYLGIWTQKNCEQFICLEPWCGLADNIDGHKDIIDKEGIIKLEGNTIFTRTYTLSFTR